MPLTDKQKAAQKKFYARNKEERLLKVKLRQLQVGKIGKIQSLKDVGNEAEIYSDGSDWQETRNRTSDTIADPRESVPPRVPIAPNEPVKAIFWQAFKPKNNVFYGEKVNARCGKLIDTVVFE